MDGWLDGWMAGWMDGWMYSSVRPHPPRGPGARRGRMGPEVGPAFQRRSRDTASSNLGVRFGGNGVQARGFKRNAYFFWHFGREITYKMCGSACFFLIVRPTLEVSAVGLQSGA
eukprot:gene16615-biopygen18805